MFRSLLKARFRTPPTRSSPSPSRFTSTTSPPFPPYASRPPAVPPPSRPSRTNIGDCTRWSTRLRRPPHHRLRRWRPQRPPDVRGRRSRSRRGRTGSSLRRQVGQLLTNMIQAMGLKREQVYIANIVKCRPPANRAPEPVEANTCTQFLVRQIDIVQPEYVVALGATAAMYLLGTSSSPLASLRGRFHDVARRQGRRHLPSGLSPARSPPEGRGLEGSPDGHGGHGPQGPRAPSLDSVRTAPQALRLAPSCDHAGRRRPNAASASPSAGYDSCRPAHSPPRPAAASLGSPPLPCSLLQNPSDYWRANEPRPA